MPLYPPRGFESYKKKETLLKRETQLRHALSSGATGEKVRLAAEKVRFAQLAVLKAERELIRYDRESEERTRQLAAFARKRSDWESLAVEDIIEQYSGSKPS